MKKNWHDVNLPIAERKQLIMKWAKKKGIPAAKAENIANKELNITAYDTAVFDLLDDLEAVIGEIDTSDFTEYVNLYDVNHYIKERLYHITDNLRELIEV